MRSGTTSKVPSHGEILATDVVRLLIPTPNGGRWADEFVPTGTSGGTTVHQLLWQRPEQPERITVVVAEDVAIIRAGIVSLLTADGMTIIAEAADYQVGTRRGTGITPPPADHRRSDAPGPR